MREAEDVDHWVRHRSLETATDHRDEADDQQHETYGCGNERVGSEP